MVATNLTYRVAQTNSTGLAETVRVYLDRHPEVSPQEFLAQAIQREIGVREQQAGEGVRHVPAAVSPSRRTEEDVRIHNWLNERLAAVRPQREGMWAKMCRLFVGRPFHWLA